MKNRTVVLLSVLTTLIVGSLLFFTLTPAGRRVFGDYQTELKRTDDDVNYDTRKNVEDTCRSMISSYNADKQTYLLYKDSEDEVLKSSANQARIRANTTASTYNNYILKNKWVWKNNVPADIFENLPMI